MTRRAPAVLALALGVPGGLAGQLSTSLDAAAATVHYDHFLPSLAASLTPAARWQRGLFTVAARGSFLRFESGHTSTQGLVTASTFSPALGRLRAELAATAGASAYERFARYHHALGEARIHLFGATGGAWMGATVGRTTYGAGPARPVTAATLALWSTRPSATLTVSATATRVGDTTYTDFGGIARWARGTATLDGSLGARVWSRGAGHGVYGEAAAAVALTPSVALVVAGGRYATDPTRGGIAGRYLSAGVRLTGLPRGQPERFEPEALLAPPGGGSAAADPSPAGAVTLEAGPVTDGRCSFVVHAAAARVELASDLTGWAPVALDSAGTGVWTVTLEAAPGLHRFDLRLDDGDWIVPAGVSAIADEFGGRVGVIVLR